jgi:hypothetical protein
MWPMSSTLTEKIEKKDEKENEKKLFEESMIALLILYRF